MNRRPGGNNNGGMMDSGMFNSINGNGNGHMGD